jgi:CRISPR-associated exonuclease Cas4
MQIGGTHIQYLLLCHRKLWLYARGINMEHTLERVAEGKYLHESSYLRRASATVEIEVGGCKIDHYNPLTQTVHETKLSDKLEHAHRSQVVYYMYALRSHGVECQSAVLEYPKLRQTERIPWTDDMEGEAKRLANRARAIIRQKECPPLVAKSICRSCSYEELCYGNEPGE